VFPDGIIMSHEQRQAAEQELIARFGVLPVPSSLRVELNTKGAVLSVHWSADPDLTGSFMLVESETEGDSDLVARSDLSTWDQFREWAVDQRPHRYIFRGQRYPKKLVSTFHRTWRKDLSWWIGDDVPRVFGPIADQVGYPLQIGDRNHNTAIWSLLQHHGYPTPMLDWSFSPFVAAYFAFQDVDPEQQESPRIFVFDQAAWAERYGRGMFIVDIAPPQLVVLESLPAGNRRTGPQQSLSTVVNVADIESFVREREAADGLSYLTACDLPAGDKPRIMRELELMGITYGSLFPGIDGVCRDMRNRLFARPV
jgi:hypothetical protein